MKHLPPSRVRQAVILVGGKGTRLGDLTKQAPKPLMQITPEHCFLDFMVENLARQGFDRILMLAGYLGEQVVERYHGRTVRGAAIEVVIELEPLGTGGALRHAAELLEPLFLVLNGDTYFDISYRTLEARLHAQPDALGVLALREVEDAARYGSVELSDGRIVRFAEKSSETAQAGLINGGIYLLRREAIDRLPEGTASLEGELFPGLVAQGQLLGVRLDGYFLDIGLPPTLEQARRELPAVRTRPAVFLDRDGVLNTDHGYVHKWSDFDWTPGAIEAIARCNAEGLFVFVVTNQAGVAHGYYEEQDIVQLHAIVQDELARHGAFVDAFYYCPYHPDAKREKYRRVHPNRKPGPGMLLAALADWPVVREASFLVGDRDTDVEAAQNADLPASLFPGGNLDQFIGAVERFAQAVGLRQNERISE